MSEENPPNFPDVYSLTGVGGVLVDSNKPEEKLNEEKPMETLEDQLEIPQQEEIESTEPVEEPEQQIDAHQEPIMQLEQESVQTEEQNAPEESEPETQEQTDEPGEDKQDEVFTSSNLPEGFKVIDPSLDPFHQVNFKELPKLATTPEIDSLSQMQLKDLMEKNILPPQNERGQLAKYIQREKINAVTDGDYITAGKLERAAQKLHELMGDDMSKTAKQMRLDDLKEKLAATQEKLLEAQNLRREKIEEEKMRNEQRRRVLEESHDKELHEFEARWNSTDFLHKFEKPSNLLMEKQAVLKSLIIQKDYDKADLVQLEIEQLEASESRKAQVIAEEKMRIDQSHLAKKQKFQMDMLADSGDQDMTELIRNQDAAIEVLLARQKQLEREIETVKLAKMPGARSYSAARSDPAMTPRTIKRYSSFRVNNKKPKIVVKPLGTILKTKKKRPVPKPL